MKPFLPLSIATLTCALAGGAAWAAQDAPPSDNTPATNHTQRSTDNSSTTNQDADNTGRNVRDRDNQNPTPLDQGSTSSDLEISRQIRRQIVANKSLTMAAQNVKIITRNGQVTLRGPVNSNEEKQTIGQIAGKVARSSTNVVNDLEVKMAASTNP